MDVRLDTLVSLKLGASREYAKEMILDGKCFVDGKVATKPGARFSSTADVLVTGEKMPFVSRGGLKLAKALQEFSIDLSDLICLDIGASTGGFTDCMLANGAKCVIALDNGHGQLALSLLRNHRVISMEGRDIRSTTPKDLPHKPDFFACDLSFISLEKVMPAIANLLSLRVQGIFLLKPQFECGPGKVNKRGVVENMTIHSLIIDRIYNALAVNGFDILGICDSPVTGRNGNKEYLIFVEKNHNPPGGIL